jgi:hypothetical protein
MCLGESNSDEVNYFRIWAKSEPWTAHCFGIFFDSFKVREASAGTVYRGLSFCPCKTVTAFDLVP